MQEFIDAGSVTTRFTNTQSSALGIIAGMGNIYALCEPMSLEVSKFLYLDLHQRTENALMEKKMIEGEMALLESQSDIELRTILVERAKENQATLIKFLGQLVDVDRDDIPIALRGTTRELRRKVEEDVFSGNSRHEALFQAWQLGIEDRNDSESDHSVQAMSRNNVYDAFERNMSAPVLIIESSKDIDHPVDTLPTTTRWVLIKQAPVLQ